MVVVKNAAASVVPGCTPDAPYAVRSRNWLRKFGLGKNPFAVRVYHLCAGWDLDLPCRTGRGDAIALDDDDGIG